MNDEVQHPAKALEGVEPVACLVNADLGAMVWPISDINEAGTYCDEGEFPELLYPATTVSALQARIATQAEHQAKALEGVQAFEFDPPPYHSEAMGCGLEDRGIRDRYEAMAYGWDEAMDRAYESIPDDLVSATTVSALQARIAELEAKLAGVTEAVCELLSNEDHALSGGIPRGYSEGSQTWDLWEQLRQVIGFNAARKESTK